MSRKTEQRVVTIDGPAGGGKSTAAKNLASDLDFDYLDTGAMYRCAALAASQTNPDWENAEEIAGLVSRHIILNEQGRTYLDGTDVSQEIRTPEITRLTRWTADNPFIRKQMVLLQRQAAEGRSIVTEGRDQGTDVFPNAPCKFYLTASAEVRARRRMNELLARGETCSFEEILSKIITRDEGDICRKVGPLRKPADAVEINSDNLTPEEVVRTMAKIVRETFSIKPPCGF